MHSVVSQGRVEAIVTSKPSDRRLLIEEAAGLGKHRKRRRRAQLKLERTQDNLDRVLDVEREARSRLRPLKRQAEAAELHERLERQTTEARWELARDTVRARRAELVAAAEAAARRGPRGTPPRRELGEVARAARAGRGGAAAPTEQREALARRAFAARSAAERVDAAARAHARDGESLAERIERRSAQLAALRAQAAEDQPDEAGRERIEALEAALAELDAERESALERELESLAHGADAAAARVAELASVVDERRAALAEADEACDVARRARRAAETSAEAARREAAKVGGELASVNQFLRSQAGAPGGARSLADELEVEAGYELALSAALGGRLGAAVVEDLPARPGGARPRRDGRRPGADRGRRRAGRSRSTSRRSGRAVPRRDRAAGPRAPSRSRGGCSGTHGSSSDRRALPPGFAGVAVTRDGRAWFGVTRELRQAPQGGAERVLAERNRRDDLVRELERAVAAERAALEAVEPAGSAVPRVRRDPRRAPSARCARPSASGPGPRRRSGARRG